MSNDKVEGRIRESADGLRRRPLTSDAERRRQEYLREQRESRREEREEDERGNRSN